MRALMLATLLCLVTVLPDAATATGAGVEECDNGNTLGFQAWIYVQAPPPLDDDVRPVDHDFDACQ